mmetsp:Transcript_25409/g.101262  ORF Transcript_25409/g.101262 Transcript_25409/m.101262 type:complete len:1067 (+) Transcript_25409:420-3620(+)
MDLESLFSSFGGAAQRSSNGSEGADYAAALPTMAACARSQPQETDVQLRSERSKFEVTAMAGRCERNMPEVLTTKAIQSSDAWGVRATHLSAIPLTRKPSGHAKEPAPRHPAKQYPFVLDPFQAMGINFIERDESVLVSAHTSAGKTVVAEYAIAKSFRDSQRVIYTSPIKALSNQKFRDLQSEFGDVGLMTGDITINPLAKCLVMTTEILRSMLYRGSEVMREVKWVIYDEIHYMRDRDRGVVWEESIILLPHTIRYVFLSATIPNAHEFAAWIATIHHQPCHVVYTEFRPTPLVHYVFPAGGNGLHLVVDELGNFRDSNFQKAMAHLPCPVSVPTAHGVASNAVSTRSRRPQQDDDDLRKVLSHVHRCDLQPCIVFSFSKNKCEKNARSLSASNYTTTAEKVLIQEIFRAAVRSLSVEDRELPQVQQLVSLLERGVGVHHGGLLPVVKEVVEILFQEGLIKVLFATETFAIGINMPAKSVIFTECRKYDGSEFRWLSAGEYIQMSGRAGRRGKDDRGTVIQMLNERIEPESAKYILCGKPEALNSSYHVTYNMLLNLLRVEGADPDHLVRSSFHRYQQASKAPALLVRADALQAKADAIDVDGLARQVHKVKRQLDVIRNDLRRRSVQCPGRVLQWLQPGRLVYFRATRPRQPSDAGSRDENAHSIVQSTGRWGVIVAVQAPKHLPSVLEHEQMSETGHHQLVDVLVGSVFDKDRLTIRNASLDSAQFWTVPVSTIVELSALRVHMPSDLRKPESISMVYHSLREIEQRFNTDVVTAVWGNGRSLHKDPLPLLDPLQDMKLNDDGDFVKHATTARKLDVKLQHLLADQPLDSLAAVWKHVEEWESKGNLERDAEKCRRLAINTSCPATSDLYCMRSVLQRLGHITKDNNVITLKGRAACEINAANELVASELLFCGAFSGLRPPVIAAMLSCLVHTDQRKYGEVELRGQLHAPRRLLLDTAMRVADAMRCASLSVDVHEFAESFNPELMELVYEWARGAAFATVIKLSDAYEGTVIRVIRRLDELIRQLASASAAIGNGEMKAQFELTSTQVRRDLVFAASLYL